MAGRVTSWSIERRTAGSFDLVNTWKDDDDVVIVDAMRSGEPPGTITWFDALQERVPSCVFSSTHSFGPMAIAELARSLDRMPRTLFVVGIEIEHTDHGAPMSPPVVLAVSRLATELQHARGKIGTGSRLSDRPGG